MTTLAFDAPEKNVPTAHSAWGPLGQFAIGAACATFAGFTAASPLVGTPAFAQRCPSVPLGTAREFTRPIAITSENVAFNPRANVKQEVAVQQFVQRVPGASERAVQRIHDLAMERFGHWPLLETVFSLEEEADGPALFVSLDTHGMDFDEQMRRELDLSQAIYSDPELVATRQRMVLTVV